ncbi:MAG: hypothetical protein B7733_15150 [Myxococcales bacterium FL481]|nr:MAG: hypothetical protein B7733_15150 [Myxococcales bacterium FL481]
MTVDWQDIAESSGEVGGRSLDLEQIGFSLRVAVRGTFDINDVPKEVVNQLEMAEAALRRAEERIKILGAVMVRTLREAGVDPRGNPLPKPEDVHTQRRRDIISRVEAELEQHMGETEDEFGQRVMKTAMTDPAWDLTLV